MFFSDTHKMIKLMLCVILLCAVNAYAQEQNQSTKTGGWLDRTFEWIERTRDSLSQTVGSTAEAIDRYGSEELFDHEGKFFDPEQANDSYVRLRLTQDVRRYQRGENNIRLSAKVDLPNTQHHVKFIFDSEPEDFNAIGDKSRQSNTGAGDVDQLDEKAVAGIRFSENPEKGWRKDVDIGARLRSDLDMYTRFRLERVYPFAQDEWKARVLWNNFYFHSRGWGSETSVNFIREYNKHLIFWTTTEGQYVDRDNNWELLHAFQLRHILNKNNQIEYQMGVSAATKPFPRTDLGIGGELPRSSNVNIKPTDAWLRINWLHRLYKDWLYVKVSPEAAYPRSNDYHFTPAIYVELEAFFSTSPSLSRIRIDY